LRIYAILSKRAKEAVLDTTESSRATGHGGREATAQRNLAQRPSGTAGVRPPAVVVETREIAEDAFRPDARARAILRGKAFAEADLKAAGGAFDIEEVRKLLNGITRQAVDKRVADGALLAVPGPSGRRRFPTVQFNTDGSVVAGLKAVIKALDFSSPWAVLNFLINANDQLGGEKPIEVLRKGAVDRVVLAANSVGVQGA
jgi:hypothetical protein